MVMCEILLAILILKQKTQGSLRNCAYYNGYKTRSKTVRTLVGKILYFLSQPGYSATQGKKNKCIHRSIPNSNRTKTSCTNSVSLDCLITAGFYWQEQISLRVRKRHHSVFRVIIKAFGEVSVATSLNYMPYQACDVIRTNTKP